MTDVKSIEELQKKKEYWASRISMKRDELKELYGEIVQQFGPKIVWTIEQKNHELFVAASNEALIVGEMNERDRAEKANAEAVAASLESQATSQSEVPSETPE